MWYPGNWQGLSVQFCRGDTSRATQQRCWASSAAACCFCEAGSQQVHRGNLGKGSRWSPISSQQPLAKSWFRARRRRRNVSSRGLPPSRRCARFARHGNNARDTSNDCCLRDSESEPKTTNETHPIHTEVYPKAVVQLIKKLHETLLTEIRRRKTIGCGHRRSSRGVRIKAEIQRPVEGRYWRKHSKCKNHHQRTSAIPTPVGSLGATRLEVHRWWGALASLFPKVHWETLSVCFAGKLRMAGSPLSLGNPAVLSYTFIPASMSVEKTTLSTTTS